MLTRWIARPLLATWFVAEGVDAFRRPAPHVERTRDAWRRLATRGDIPEPPASDTLRTIVKAHGAAMAAAGIMLALGKAPRLSACTLAALTVPLAVVDAPAGGSTHGGQPGAGGQRHGRPSAALLRDLSLVGGTAMAALDRGGRPGVAWRLQHARVDREAELQARRAVAGARKEARHLVKQARKATGH